MHRALRSGLSLLTTFCITLLLFTGAVIPTGAVEAGDILAPDMDKWGQQNNNGWYYMYKKGTAYAEMPFFDSTSEIGWQQNAFASDPAAMGEMFFINQQSFFIGEGGGMPVYAFKAPASGQVELYFETHGTDQIRMQVFQDDTLLQVDGQDTIAFNTNGNTPHTLTLDVKKGTMLYLVGYTTGANRDGWIFNYRVKYLSVGGGIAAGDILSPDMDKWGIQNNNGWHYMYKKGAAYAEMPYFDSTSEIGWQQNAYASDPTTMGEMFFINQQSFFVGENGGMPVYAFKAPAGGRVELYFETHGTDQIRMQVFQNDTLLQVDGQDAIAFNTNGNTPHTLTLDVKKGTMLYLVGYTTGANRDGWIFNYRVKYLSVNSEEEAQPSLPADGVEGSAKDWNKTLADYTALQAMTADRSKPLTWLFVGDSITANDGNTSEGFRNYTEIFEGYLQTELGRSNDRVVNTAVSGWKVGNIDFDRDIAAYHPDVVYVKIGTNDSFASDNDALAFYKNLKTLFQKIEASGAIPVIAAANGFSSKWGNAAQRDYFAARYPQVIRGLAKEMDLLFVDYFSAYAADANRADNNWFCPDAIHPNRQGYLALAQTLIKDLGLETADSLLLSQNPDQVTSAEVLPDMVFSTVKPEDSITDGTAVTLEQVKSLLNNGFVLMGGGNAVGGTSLITRRSMAQLLDNNNQRGRRETLYSSIDTLKTAAANLGTEKALILMPEATGIKGENLSAADNRAAIEELVTAALTAGQKILLVTPPPVFTDTGKNTAAAALATAVREVAAAKKVPLVDLNGYLTAVAAQEERVRTQWADADGFLNGAGSVEAATLLARALGIDYAGFSANRFTEDYSQENWGQQNVGGWSYLYQKKTGGDYMELPFIQAADAAEAWIADRYALSDPYQFLFIGKEVFHAAANYNPVKAFQAPIGGRVRITVQAKRSTPDLSEGGELGTMTLQVLKNKEALALTGDNTKVTLLAGGGAYQTYVIETDVKKNTMLYFIAEGSQPLEGYMKQTVTYLSTNSEVEEPVVEDPYIGKTFSPDMKDWGKQNNNGWYFMYQKKGSSLYNELTWRDSSAAIDWQKNNFAFDPDEMGEMLFISQGSFFVGEKGSKPVYAFKAPIGGQVEFIVTTHGTPDIRMQLFKNDELLQVDGQDTVIFNTDGNTTHKVTVEVKKDTMLYIVASNAGENREGWLIDYGVKYLSTNGSVEGDDQPVNPDDPYAGKIYAPDASKWGTQNNNGWYYMYKERLGNNYRELTWYDGSAAISWQQNRYAFDPDLMAEMLFISPESFFVGENGSKPTYAFKAPVGGRVELSVITHGTSDMRMQIFQNNELVKVDGEESIVFNTEGNTEHIITLDVKKDTMIYLVGSSAGEAREGWIFGTSVKYLSSNDQVESGSTSLTGKSFTIDISPDAWGKKNNNNWEFMFWDTADKAFKSLAFVRSENMFKGPSDAGYEYLMIKTQEMHPSIQGFPAKVFVAPADGRVEISAAGILHSANDSPTKTGITFLKGTTKIYPTNAQYVTMGSKETVVRAVVDVKKGDRIAVLLDPIDGNISFDATNVMVCATYLSAEGEENPDDPTPSTGHSLPVLPLAMAAAGGAAVLAISRKRRKA